MSAAVLLLAHGTPESPEQVPEYLQAVTGGRRLPEAVIAEVRHRYELIGHSPLTELTHAQASVLEAKLGGVRVYVGMRNWRPWIKDTVAQMLADGVARAAVICLAPQNSRTSVGLYRKAVMEAATEGLSIEFVEAWPSSEKLIAAFAERLFLARGQAPSNAPVLFTAHSVPCRTIQDSTAGAGDPYSHECKQSARLVAARVGIAPEQWFFAFQSQGMSGGPWIGPTVEETLAALAGAGHRHVVVQPVGFLCDHVEVLYDIDIAFQRFAGERGMKLTRAESLNTSELLAEALAEIAQERLAKMREEAAAR